MVEVAANSAATQARIARRLARVPPAQAAAVVEDELRGLYHGLFVIFDGGTALADEGLVRIRDDEGGNSTASCTRYASAIGRKKMHEIPEVQYQT